MSALFCPYCGKQTLEEVRGGAAWLCRTCFIPWLITELGEEEPFVDFELLFETIQPKGEFQKAAEAFLKASDKEVSL